MSQPANNLRKISSACVVTVMFRAAAVAQLHPFVSFDVPGAIGDTTPVKINATGQVVGYFLANGYHGFVRNPDWQIIQFDPPGAIDAKAVSINRAGQVVGYGEPSLCHERGFVRSASGRFLEVTHPEAGSTWATSITTAMLLRDITANSNNVSHGFIRDTSGAYTSFDAPGADIGNSRESFPRP